MANPFIIPSLIGAVGSGLSAGFAPEPSESNLHLVNPTQQALYKSLAARFNAGAGDDGFGTGFRQGKSQLAQMFADRGITPDVSESGAYAGALGNLAGTTGAAAAQNRFSQGLNLLRSPLQTATITGENFIPR
jgi:hypothetical protein